MDEIDKNIKNARMDVYRYIEFGKEKKYIFSTTAMKYQKCMPNMI